MVRHLERLPATLPDDLGCPNVSLILPRAVLSFDHRGGPTRLFFHQIDGDSPEGLMDNLLSLLSGAVDDAGEPDPPLPRFAERDNMTREMCAPWS